MNPIIISVDGIALQLDSHPSITHKEIMQHLPNIWSSESIRIAWMINAGILPPEVGLSILGAYQIAFRVLSGQGHRPGGGAS